jgi:multidrug efflux pump subunit AcrA (membrane-fusion protein)
MFGRIFIPLDEESVLVIPRAAVREVGHLTQVEVVENGKPSRRSVRLGRTFGDEVEVLAGLQEGEEVLVVEDATGDIP